MFVSEYTKAGISATIRTYSVVKIFKAKIRKMVNAKLKQAKNITKQQYFDKVFLKGFHVLLLREKKLLAFIDMYCKILVPIFPFCSVNDAFVQMYQPIKQRTNIVSRHKWNSTSTYTRAMLSYYCQSVCFINQSDIIDIEKTLLVISNIRSGGFAKTT